jgi:hypothetical protein
MCSPHPVRRVHRDSRSAPKLFLKALRESERKSGHHTHVGRSRFGHEGARPEQAAAAQDEIGSVSTARPTARVPAEPLTIMLRPVLKTSCFAPTGQRSAQNPDLSITVAVEGVAGEIDGGKLGIGNFDAFGIFFLIQFSAHLETSFGRGRGDQLHNGAEGA